MRLGSWCVCWRWLVQARYSADLEEVIEELPEPGDEREEEERPRMAAPICYRRLADVKEHLREDHGLEPKDVKVCYAIVVIF